MRITLPTTALVSLAVVLGLLVPMPQLGRALQAALNFLHGPAFATLAVVLWLGIRGKSPFSGIVTVLLIWFAVAGVGLLTEFSQLWLGRQPSRDDLLADLLGATAGLLWITARREANGLWYCGGRRAASLSLLLIAGWFPLLNLFDCYRQRQQMPILASFEDWLEMSRWTHSEGESRLKRDPLHVTHGIWSIRIDFTSGKYPAATLRWPVSDWLNYNLLLFDVYLEGPDEMRLIVKVEDRFHNKQPSNRFHRSILLNPGPQTVRIPLAEIASAPQQRLLDLQQVTRLQFFTVRPKTSRTLYLDNIRLH